MKRRPVGIGIIGGGLMGRETASAFARWRALTDVTVEPQLVGVADLNPAPLEWFDDGQTFLTGDYRELLNRDEIEILYVAVPHNLHAKIYGEVLEAGKDLLAENRSASTSRRRSRSRPRRSQPNALSAAALNFRFCRDRNGQSKRFVRDELGRVLEVTSGLHHSSDLDPTKTANWKRQSKICGEIGVLGDLGMHVCHVPLRLEVAAHSLVCPTAERLPRTAGRQRRQGGVRHLGQRLAAHLDYH